MGPLTTARGVDKVARQVDDARDRGARILLGGKAGSGADGAAETTNGYFYEPTVITGATKEMLVSREETFGPLCALYAFETEEEAVRLANDTSMGLASYVFTQDVDRLWRMFENLEAGMIGLNTGMRFFSLKRPLLSLHLMYLPILLGHEVKLELTSATNRQPVCCGKSVWRHQRFWVWKRVWQGRGSRRVFGHEDWDFDAWWPFLSSFLFTLTVFDIRSPLTH